ncbi:MAG: TetR/AcrR family transcriptional regulator [Actinomycetota bacterium]
MSTRDIVMMGAGMPVERLTPERRRGMTREALVEAAADVFARRGFQAASLDEIAESAGFTRGAIYSNFGGKEELLIAVLDVYTERQLREFGAAIDSVSEGTGEEQSAAAAAVWSHTRRDLNITLLSLEMRLYALRNPDFRKRLAIAERRQQGRIAEFIAHVAGTEGRQLRIEPADLAEILRAFSDGLGQLATLDEERSDEYDRIAMTFFGMIAEAATPEEESGKS